MVNNHLLSSSQPENLRQSGLEVIGSVPWGTHFCQFYMTSEDLVETLLPYFLAGLAGNEFCMWVTSAPLQVDQATAALRRALPDLDEYLARGQIEILDYSQWYTPAGQFDADTVLQGWLEKLADARQRGFEGLRLTGNTFWLEQSNWADFTLYEEKVNAIIGGQRMLALCTYSLEKCGVREIMDVVANHQFALIKNAGRWEIIESAEPKKMKKALVESEERYRSLFEQMTEGFALHEIILDADGNPCDYRFLEINPAFENLTGLERAKVVGKRMYEVLPDNDPYWLQIYGEVALTGKPIHFDNYSSPLQKYYDVFAFCPKPGQFAVIFTDITGRKQRETALQQMNRTLKALGRSSQAMMRAENESQYLQEVCKIITDDCGHAMVWIGFAEEDERKSIRPAAYAGFEDGYLDTLKLTWADEERGRGPTGTAIRTGKPSFCRNMLTDPAFLPWRQEAIKRGYASSIVLPLKTSGKTFGALTIYSRKPDPFSDSEVELLSELANDLAYGITTLRLRAAHAGAVDALREANAHLEQRVRERTAELESTTQELEVINEELRVEIEENQRVNRALTVSEARMRHLLQEEQAMRNQLIQSEKYAALARLVASVAHELNNPIQTIQNCMYLLETNLPADAPGRQFLDMSASEASRIAKLVDQLRETYRPAKTTTPQPFNVIEELGKVKNLLEPHLQHNRSTWRMTASQDCILVNGVSDQIKQVFLNISLNAIEAMQPGGGAISADVSIKDQDGKVTITFKDTGPGIAEENLSRIFDPFFTTKEKGTGLGLFICYEIVQTHGGDLRAASRPGEGATFIVTLPIFRG